MTNTSHILRVPKTELKRIVIVGGGFAGLNMARGLEKANAQVVLIDRYNFHTFQPLLYQTATSALPSNSVAYPFREMLSDSESFYYCWADVTGVDVENKILKSSEGTIRYDMLILATGTEVNYFGNEQIEKYALTMKSLPQAIEIRETILRNFEEADQCETLEEKKALLHFCIAGGGPTGVELAGALAEMKKYIFPKDYPHLDVALMQIDIYDGGERLLASMSEHAGKSALKSLENLGVNIYLKTEIKDYDGNILTTATDKKINTHSFIWAAGVVGKPLEGIPEEVIGHGNRYLVDETNEIKECKGIYAIGDIALMETEGFPKGHPQVAQPAIQQGQHLAKNIKRFLSGKSMKPFSYFEKGYMAVIGRNRAVADIGTFKFSGFAAWLLWTGIHLFFLAGFRNRLLVFFSWIYNYVTSDKASRLILKSAQSKV